MMARQCCEGMDTTRAVCSSFGERADAAASLCVQRSSFVGHPRSDTASMWQSPTPACTAILRNCLIDNKFQFRSSAKKSRPVSTNCENVPAVASQQAATGYGILSETSGLGLPVGRDLPSVRAARQPNSTAADPVTAKTASRSASHRRNPLVVLIKAHLCRRRLPHLPRSLGRAAPAAPPPTISRRRSRSPAAAPQQSQQEAD
jgi:hypothetical protein